MSITADLVVQAAVLLCVLAVLLAVLVDFLLYDRRSDVRKSKQSIVRTSTMLLFFLGYYLVIRWQWGILIISSKPVGIILDIVGLLLLIAGAVFNIAGRIKINKNWGNNIRIYADHALITAGPFRLVRHPLYASLMWMFAGGSAIYRNYLSLLLTILIFVPFMTYRARQEEVMLAKEFPSYQTYKNRTGMFFPRLSRRS